MSGGRRELILVQPLKERGMKYRVVEKSTGKEVCVANIKVASTRTVIRACRLGDVSWFELREQRGQRRSYAILDDSAEPIGKIEFTKTSQFMPEFRLQFGGLEFIGKGAPQASSFEVYEKDGKLVMTVDKNLLALDDTFKIVAITDFDIRLALAIALAIDDTFFN